MTVIPSALDVQDEATRQTLADLHTCMPAEVVAVRSGSRDQRQFVDVLPMVQRSVLDADGMPVDEAFPVLQMVPVGYMQGGGFFVSMPLRIGDVVLVVFAERSLDTWIENAIPGARSPVVPGDLSTHSLQGAIALPLGPAPRAALAAGVDGADMVIGTVGGTVLARFKADGSVSFAEGAGGYIALSAKVDAFIASLDQVFRTWAPMPNDGGAALKTKYTTTFESPPESVAATKTKAT